MPACIYSGVRLSKPCVVILHVYLKVHVFLQTCRWANIDVVYVCAHTCVCMYMLYLSYCMCVQVRECAHEHVCMWYVCECVSTQAIWLSDQRVGLALGCCDNVGAWARHPLRTHPTPRSNTFASPPFAPLAGRHCMAEFNAPCTGSTHFSVRRDRSWVCRYLFWRKAASDLLLQRLLLN